MHIAIRTDASRQIGTGHVMRCLTLAQTLRHKQHTVRFICRDLEGNLIEHIRNNGFNIQTLPAIEHAHSDNRLKHAHWLPLSQQQDSVQTQDVLTAAGDIDWLVVDHYALDSEWQRPLQAQVGRILVIDDLADRDHLADMLLDQNLYTDMSQRYQGRLPAHCQQLLGPRHTLLRDEFTRLRSKVKPRRGEVKRILVFFGGVDAGGLTLKTLRALQGLEHGLHIDAVAGAQNPDAEAIFSLAATDAAIHAHRHVDNMAELMLNADLAIGAGGTTTWERCYLGLPAVVFTLAHNQAELNATLSQQGVCLLAGEANVSEAVIRRAVQNLLAQPRQIATMSKNALALMHDHSGAAGVVAIMEKIHG